ncbi:MAG: glycosyltransferase family 9 protein [Candidatus Omnitrophica bacterium]|nr:glycosyltransferase family 9 protein [Candidatus Omnitrophota bacterium]
MVKKILVMGHSNIGDVCYDLAVIAPLRERFPDSRLTFLTTSRCRDLVDGYPGVDNIMTFDRHGNHKGLLGRIRFFGAARRELFDLVVVLKRSLRHKFLRAREVWCVKKKAASKHKHPVDRYRDFLLDVDIPVETVSFSFREKQEHLRWAEQFLAAKNISAEDTLIGILPLAAWSLKSWPVAKWNALADQLRNRYGIKVINLGKMPDSSLGRQIAAEISPDVVAAGETDLAQAKALLRRCSMFIGPDSSFLHLASCMGVETVGLFGATSGEIFYPYFHRHNIVTAKKRLSCMPCYPGTLPSCSVKGRVRNFGPCMEAVSVEDVMGIIKQRLNLK